MCTIVELKDLCNDELETYNASQNKTFCMRVAMMWNINDFLTYALYQVGTLKGYCMSCLYVGQKL